MKKIKLGLMGLGSAGMRHAIAFSNFPNVDIIGIVDDKKELNYKKLLDINSNFSNSKYFKEDNEFLGFDKYDGIVISADPLSMSRTFSLIEHKQARILGFTDNTPLLWERPLGINSTDIDAYNVSESYSSVINFDRFAAVSQIREIKNLIGELISTSSFISLSIPKFDEKPWRYSSAIKLTTHLVDHITDTFNYLNLPKIINIDKISSQNKNDDNVYDSSICLLIKFENGSCGTINITQFPYEGKEFMHPFAHSIIAGTKGIAKITLSSVEIVLNSGEKIVHKIKPIINESFLIEAKRQVLNYLINEEGYIDNEETEAEAISIVNCDYEWYKTLTESGLKSEVLGTISSNRYTMSISDKIN